MNYVIPKQHRSTYYYLVLEIRAKPERVVLLPVPWNDDIDRVHHNLYRHAPWGWAFALDRGRNEIHIIKWREDEDPPQEI
jgi:hypothetical protein